MEEEDTTLQGAEVDISLEEATNSRIEAREEITECHQRDTSARDAKKRVILLTIAPKIMTKIMIQVDIKECLLRINGNLSVLAQRIL